MTGREITQRIHYYENLIEAIRKDMLEMIISEFDVCKVHDKVEELNDSIKKLRQCENEKYQEVE